MAGSSTLLDTLIQNSERARSYDFSLANQTDAQQQNCSRKVVVEGLIQRKKEHQESRPSYTFAL